MKTTYQKFKTVIDKNTFYFFNADFEEKHESYLISVKETLLVIKNAIENQGLKKEIFENMLCEKEYGLRALLALTGISNETLKRLTTIIRVANDPELNKLVCKNMWSESEDIDNLKEWSDRQVAGLIRNNKHFRKVL